MKICFFVSLISFAFTLLSTDSSCQSVYLPHFKIQTLSHGVYAAIAEKDGHAVCNAGIIDLGDQTLIIDPFLSLDAAADLKAAALALTGHPVTVVINTHFHDDHTGGNQVFSTAKIISTATTQNLYLKEQPLAIERDKHLAPLLFKRFSSKDTAGMNSHERSECNLMVRYFEAQMQSADSLRLTPPDSVFSGELVLSGSKRTVQLIETGIGHTSSDLVVWLERDRILFAGDLVFAGFHPYIGDGDPQKWMSGLKQLEHLGAQTVIPGHGPVSNTSSIRTMEKYLTMIRNVARNKRDDNSAVTIPKPFDTWYLANFFGDNIDFIRKQNNRE
jgi:cyclase